MVNGPAFTISLNLWLHSALLNYQALNQPAIIFIHPFNPVQEILLFP